MYTLTGTKRQIGPQAPVLDLALYAWRQVLDARLDLFGSGQYLDMKDRHKALVKAQERDDQSYDPYGFYFR